MPAEHQKEHKVIPYLYISSLVVHPHSPVHTRNGNFQVCWYKLLRDHLARVTTQPYFHVTVPKLHLKSHILKLGRRVPQLAE
jgi:hypothetical protein